jgi:hypothetical protein
MGISISSQQSSALTGQSAADALLRTDNLDKSETAQPSDIAKPLGASYELSLSESAQAAMGSKTSAVNNAEEAQRQIDLIKSAVQQSPTVVLSMQKPDVKSVIDLLA